MSKPIGKVYIAGAGPGDPGLVTYKCFEILKKADVIIYDYLACKDLLSYSKVGAEKIYVGKTGSTHEMEQDEINELMVRKAKEHPIVLRLKGGDPFIFGRGGEEALYLAEQGIPYEIIPGVSSSFAVPAFAGIPLTHRGLSSQVVIVTGHEAEGKKDSAIDWKMLATFKGTIVVLMGMKNLGSITANLLDSGMDPDTSVCVIEWGATPKQRVLVSNIKNVDRDVKNASMGPPSVVVIGDVVRLREKLKWYEKLPLHGKTIVVTRPPHQGFETAAMLKERGANVVTIPAIVITPIIPNEALTKALESLRSYHGIIFTSVNGVKVFFEALSMKGMDSRDLYGIKVFAIGPKTASELKLYGIRADFVPERYLSQSIIEILGKIEVKGKKFLFPRALEGNETIPKFIQASGGVCDVIPVYKAEAPPDKQNIEEIPDMIAFMSSSAVRNFVTMYGREVLTKTKIASIGPETTKTLKSFNIEIHVEAKRHDALGLVEEIERFFKGTCL
ncbi:MAG: uroporphyrinogen-III C-methyltransferase [Desulfobacterota bacterium]|nr:uroporphyrinogen-III C-methyltransferase [Thermodesulfobacteriota bacterium]MDW8002149.1 uroporphyrinogen-III C-methyltransferase [Deltaproteobacteria bacterium]